MLMCRYADVLMCRCDDLNLIAILYTIGCTNFISKELNTHKHAINRRKGNRRTNQAGDS